VERTGHTAFSKEFKKIKDRGPAVTDPKKEEKAKCHRAITKMLFRGSLRRCGGEREVGMSKTEG